MFSSKTLALLGLLTPFTLAQYGGGPVSGPATTSAPAAGAVASPSSSSALTQTVTAGVGGPTDLSWTPNTVTANAGTFVEFEFMGLNHSVAGSTFAAPCMPPSSGSFFAGFNFNTSSGPSNNSFVLAVNGPDPIFFYCPQTVDNIHHCARGMVGIINPAPAQNITQFVANAMAPNVTVLVPPTVTGGMLVIANASTPAPSSAASHITVGMGLMGLVSLGFSALLSF